MNPRSASSAGTPRGGGRRGALLNESSSLIPTSTPGSATPPSTSSSTAASRTKGIEAEAYAGIERPPDPETGEEVAREFVPLKTSLTFSDGERVCIDRMIRGQGDEPFESAESLAELPTEQDDVKDDFNDLLDSIDDILAYAKLVQKGEVVPDPKVARCIGDALAALPKIEPASSAAQARTAGRSGCTSASITRPSSPSPRSTSRGSPPPPPERKPRLVDREARLP